MEVLKFRNAPKSDPAASAAHNPVISDVENPSYMTTPDIDTQVFEQALQDRLPRYAVILYNDDYHSMDYVVEALVKSVPDLIIEEAVGIMFEAHNTGSAVVVVCLLEQAELYRDRIQGYGLGVSIRRE